MNGPRWVVVTGLATVAAVAALACTRPRREVEPDIVLPQTHDVPATTRSVGPRTSRACEDFARRELDAIAAVETRLGITDDSQREPHRVGYCAMTTGGSWRLAAPSLADIDQIENLWYALQARYVVVFQPTEGPASTLAVRERLFQYGERRVHEPTLYDFDGDGVEEFFVDVEEVGEEGHYARQVDLWSYRHDRLQEYEPAAQWAFETLEDIDGDRRPDLLLLAGYDDWLEHCGSGFPFDRPTPLFVAHGRPDGTFTTSDDTAKRFALGWCPAKPKRIGSSQDAVCARLWAHSSAETTTARRSVTMSCTRWSCSRDMAGLPQSRLATYDCERRIKWFDREPPFTLP